MATIKNVYFQDDVAEMIKKEDNISQLICDLIRKHYQEKNMETMTLEEIELELKRIKLEEEYAEQKEELCKKKRNF